MGELIRHLDEYLDVSSFKDFCPNGLQVEGRKTITGIVTGVSVSSRLISAAIRSGAGCVIVHHGLIWKSEPKRLTGPVKMRLALLFKNEINLLAYHLPLDAHPEIGNNAIMARKIGGRGIELQPFGEHEGRRIGWIFSLPRPVSRKTILERARRAAGGMTVSYPFGRGSIRRVAVVTGGAAEDVTAAHEEGADIYVTGEVKEQTQEFCREAGMNFVALGHARSEESGIRALGRYLSGKYGIPSRFVRIRNEF